MKTTAPIPQHIDASGLLRWLTDPRLSEYLGPTAALRLDVLGAVMTGGNLAEVGRKHGVSREAAAKQGRRARAIWQPKVDSKA